MKISVVVVTCRRFQNLERILKAWMDQTDEVFLADCSGGKFKTSLPIIHVQFSKDVGNKTMHALSELTEGDFVIHANDDLLPLPGLVEDFVFYYEELGDAIYGLIGRTFHGLSYYKDTTYYKSNRLEKPVEVDFSSHCFTPRIYLGYDLKGCHNAIEDLFWHMKVFPKVRKYVIPTKNYEDLPECNDEGCLFHDQEARRIREEFYREYYLKHYAYRKAE